jgi:hypothetical protein
MHLGYMVLWLVTGLLMLYSFVGYSFDINLFGWYPHYFGNRTAAFALIFLACGMVTFVLGARRKSQWASGLLLIGSVAILYLGCSMLYSERLSPNTFLGRDEYSPWWYKAINTAIFSLPLAGVLIGGFRSHYSLHVVRRDGHNHDPSTHRQ